MFKKIIGGLCTILVVSGVPVKAEELVIEVKTSVWGYEGALNITLCSFLELCIDN